jgi:hypothetical protein
MSDLIYKFLTAEYGLRALESGQLKVSITNQLNDIYDCAPIPGPLEVKPDFVPTFTSKYMIDHDPLANGLLCFSKNCVSPLLWGHYALSATGMAIGFDC